MNQKNFSQKGLGIILLLMLCLSTPLSFSSNAASSDVSSESLSMFAEYDLNIGGTQTFIIQDANNDAINITISEEQPMTRLENRTYSVSFKSPLAWEAGYKVDVYNNSITSVHSAWNREITGKILYARLKKDSSKQATYYLTYQKLTFVTSPGVRTTISGTTMKVFGI